jgi:drug/metabolite transporter (DMT)-like permease
MSKRVRDRMGTLEYITVVHVVAALVVTPVAAIQPGELASVPGRDWLLLSFVVLFSGALGHFLVNWAHPHVDVTVSSLMMLGVPIVATAVAWIVLDEPLTLLQGLGGAIALGAIVAIVRRPARAPESWEEAPGAAVGADL